MDSAVLERHLREEALLSEVLGSKTEKPPAFLNEASDKLGLSAERVKLLTINEILDVAIAFSFTQARNPAATQKKKRTA